MVITVEQILAMRRLKLDARVAGNLQAQVRWVAVSELLDPTAYLTGGEILLTTGINAPQDGPAWTTYVRRLSGRGVVALGFGVGLSHADIPAGLLAAAEQAGLTLFAVPEATPFLDIIKAVANSQVAQERATAESMLATQRALTKAATEPDGSGITRRLASLIPGAWVGVLGVDGELEFGSGPLPPGARAAGLAGLVGRIRPAGMRGSVSDSGPEGSTVIHPLGLRASPHSYLAVISPHPLDGATRGAITTSVALLSLHSERLTEQSMIRRKIRAGALALALNGELRSCNALMSIAGETRWRSASQQVRVLRAGGTRTQLEEASRRLEGLIQQSHRRLLIGAVEPAGAEEAFLQLLVEASASRISQVTALLHSCGARTGVGGRKSFADAGTSDVEAREALARTGGSAHTVYWDSLVSAGIAQLLPADTATAYADGLLAPLHAADSPGARLLPTLQAFLSHNGNRRQTAADLGIHRNTLIQRLGLIEQHLGRSLEEPQLRADLWIALRIVQDQTSPKESAGPVHGHPAPDQALRSRDADATVP
ncbi:PucR family transcriptional regulator [Arthrobacter sp. I2-34]|uniref:PucR family transcriptional regulator n=1 Tax=Arthrobacter hankyongi TaxID=2904801 RepID=A0ABS9L365_9MICC|nr:PucR family transcriptional regulator [Arthrobacter hankyongi]MCG2621085.1 PucR family transcriptional regulator [Arthrobacter hankyongi]